MNVRKETGHLLFTDCLLGLYFQFVTVTYQMPTWYLFIVQ